MLAMPKRKGECCDLALIVVVVVVLPHLDFGSHRITTSDGTYKKV